jgi:hypothetical protein
MTAALHIDRLATRIRGGDVRLAGEVQRVIDGPLRRDLDGVADRALASAGLPATTAVAVRRLALRLRVGARVDAASLALGWTQACETALVGTLSQATLAGESDQEEADLVWFPDAWAAEVRHLERCAHGLPTAWWAPQLAAGATAGGLAGGAADALRPVRILARWVAQDPARAVATMTALAGSGAPVATLLDLAEAWALSQALVGRVAAGAVEGPRTPPSTAALHGFLDAALLGAWGLASVLPAQACTRPWLAAALFARTPALSQVPAAWIESLLDRALDPGGPLPVGRPGIPVVSVPDSVLDPAAHPLGAQVRSAMARAQTQDAQRVTPASEVQTQTVHAGGLLLLIRPLAKLGLLPEAPLLAGRLGDLALAALRRVLAPLPPGEFAVAQERERPLLALFAPGCDWRGRIAGIPILDPGPAEDLLATLTAVIPAGVAFAPGAARRVFGTPTPAIATAAGLRLARLLLRPGLLHVNPWEAELTWPLAAADLALRRAGWDQDPGWVPWLGRNLSFRFRGGP